MNSESTKYNIKGTRVKGNGWSYNLNNQKDAIKLCETLNNYENITQLNNNIEQQYDRIQKQLIQVNMTLQILNDEITTLTSGINELKSNDR